MTSAISLRVHNSCRTIPYNEIKGSQCLFIAYLIARRTLQNYSLNCEILQKIPRKEFGLSATVASECQCLALLCDSKEYWVINNGVYNRAIT